MDIVGHSMRGLFFLRLEILGSTMGTRADLADADRACARPATDPAFGKAVLDHVPEGGC